MKESVYTAYEDLPLFLNAETVAKLLGIFISSSYELMHETVYAYLMYCEDRKTFQCHPSYKTIGKAVGMSKNTVRKHVDGLTKKRLITTEPTSVYTQKGEKRNGNLLYTVRPIEDAVEYHYGQQMIRLECEMRCQSALKKLAEFDRKHKKSAV